MICETFSLESSPAVKARKFSRIGVLERFRDAASWTMEDVERVYEILAKMDDGPAFLDELWEEIWEFQAIAKRGPFPTARELRRMELMPGREARNARWFGRLLATASVREREIEGTFPVRKTYKAKANARAKGLAKDATYTRINRVKTKLESVDPEVVTRYYKSRQAKHWAETIVNPEPFRVR